MSLSLEKLQIYRQAMDMGETIWKLAGDWNFFAKDTVGKQLVRCADSVAANLSEGFGRFFYEENRQFCYYSRGSLFETKTWLRKAHHRNLISPEQFEKLMNEIETVGIKLNNYIRSIGPVKRPKTDGAAR